MEVIDSLALANLRFVRHEAAWAKKLRFTSRFDSNGFVGLDLQQVPATLKCLTRSY